MLTTPPHSSTKAPYSSTTTRLVKNREGKLLPGYSDGRIGELVNREGGRPNPSASADRRVDSHSARTPLRTGSSGPESGMRVGERSFYCSVDYRVVL